MKRWTGLVAGAVVLASPMAAMAGNDMAGMGSVSLYATQQELEIPALGPTDDDIGFGLKGWYSFGLPFVHFEYQQAKPGDNKDTYEIDMQQFRLGGGAAFALNPQFLALGKAEYVSLANDITLIDGEDTDVAGYGLHVGGIWMPTPQLHVGLTLGFLDLGGDDTDGLGDVDGLEYNLGVGYDFTKEWGAFLDYRKFDGEFEVDAGGGSQDWTMTDLRFGGTFSFGGK
jgi:hypothetical protein